MRSMGRVGKLPFRERAKLLSRLRCYSGYQPSPFLMDEQTINVRPPVWALIAAVVIGGGFYLAGKNIEKQPALPSTGTITVSGEGKVSVVPDIAELNFGVQTGRMSTAKDAMKKLSDSMTKIYDAVKKSGVDEKDIKTASFYLNPIYDYTTGGQVFRGFEASQSLTVKVRDLDKVSDVLGAATGAGANQAGGVNFTVDKPEAKQAEARAMAITQAKEKAEELAKQLGVHLGDISGFSEGGNGYMPPIMMMKNEAYGRGGAADVAQSIPLPAGEQDVQVTVSITYELED